jgi:hypothetical protein
MLLPPRGEFHSHFKRIMKPGYLWILLSMFWTVMPVPNVAAQANSCLALTGEMYDVVVQNSSRSLDEQFNTWLDQLSSEDFERKQNSGLRLTIPGTPPLGLDGKYTREQYASYKTRVQQGTAARLRIEEVSSTYERRASREVLETIRHCLDDNQLGPKAYWVPAGDSGIIVVARYRGGGMERAHVQEFRVANARVLGRGLRRGDVLIPGGTAVELVRTNPAQPTRVILNTTRGTVPPLVIPRLEPLGILLPTIRDQILVGRAFTVSFLSNFAGHATIRPGATLYGTYTQGTGTWTVRSPQHPTRPNHPYPYPNPVIHPSSGQLNLWGAPFQFDENGKVYFQGREVGRVWIDPLPH